MYLSFKPRDAVKTQMVGVPWTKVTKRGVFCGPPLLLSRTSWTIIVLYTRWYTGPKIPTTPFLGPRFRITGSRANSVHGIPRQLTVVVCLLTAAGSDRKYHEPSDSAVSFF
jgi:hypothetical protein